MTMSLSPSSEFCRTIAQRIVEDVGVAPGALVLIRDRAGDRAMLDAVMLAVEERGGTPLPEINTPEYLIALLTRTDPGLLAGWDARRADWLRSADRIIKLAGGPTDLAGVSAAALDAWEEAIQRLSQIEDERHLPSVLVALPVPEQAKALQMSVQEMEALLRPALAVSVSELRAELAKLGRTTLESSNLTIVTGENCVLHLRREGRPWHVDDGIIDSVDQRNGGHVANLPAGALYTTVLEDATEGDLWLDHAGPARDVHLHFERGRVTSIEAGEGAAELEALFDDESGESRRISHVGMGFNPHLQRPIGWVLVDEHVHGALIVAFGENRYLGGQNASSLNIDFCSMEATIRADGRTIVERGTIAGVPCPTPNEAHLR